MLKMNQYTKGISFFQNYLGFTFEKIDSKKNGFISIYLILVKDYTRDFQRFWFFVFILFVEIFMDFHEILVLRSICKQKHRQWQYKLIINYQRSPYFILIGYEYAV